MNIMLSFSVFCLYFVVVWILGGFCLIGVFFWGFIFFPLYAVTSRVVKTVVDSQSTIKVVDSLATIKEIMKHFL